MENQQISQLVTIATRFSKLQNDARVAAKSTRELRFSLFTDFISKEDFDTISNALDIMEKIAGSTSERDAIKYFTNQLNQKQ